MSAATNHDERLSVPWWWWLLGLFLGFTLVVAVWAILDATWALGTALGVLVLLALMLIPYGRARVRATDAGLEVLGAHIEWEWVRGAEVLDETATRAGVARASDGRTWLALRAYLPRSVLVALDDPADPHTAWLVSTRDPDHLATAITAHATRSR